MPSTFSKNNTQDRHSEAKPKNLQWRSFAPSGLRMTQYPIFDLGLSHYQEAHKFQLECHLSATLNNLYEAIIITEHYPVYTLGRGVGNREKVGVNGTPVVSVERGGQITYHGPGQIVGYPILNLTQRRLSIPQYLRKLEIALAEALHELGVEAEYREENLAGLWAGSKKLVSIGIAVRRGVAFHGFALNVDCDLAPFRAVNPCGLPGDQITSLKDLGMDVKKEEVKEWVVKKLIKHFF